MPSKEQAKPSAAAVPFRATEASAVLDLMRGVAALLVLLDHARHLFFGAVPLVNPQGRWGFLFSASEGLTNSGPEAVVIFFVLSGYLVAGSALRWMQRGQWSWRRYLIHRLVRLWLVLLPALLLGALWDAWRTKVFLSSATSLQSAGLTWSRFFGNLFFLQTLRTGTFGSNRPLWSLSFEFWFYILFPLLTLLWVRRGDLKAVLLNAVLLVGVSAFIGHSMLALFPIWLMGATLNQAPALKVKPLFRSAAVVVYFAAYAFIVAHPWRAHLLKPGYVLGVLTATGCLLALSARNEVHQNGPFARISRGLAGFSYSLYLVHYPLLAFLAAMLLRDHGLWSPSLAGDARVAGLAILVATYAWLVSRCTEAHTEAVRDWFERRLLPLRTHPVSAETRSSEVLTLR